MRIFSCAAVAFLLLPLVGCQMPPKESTENAMSETQGRMEDARVTVLATPAHCGLTAPGLVLAQSQQDWQRLSSKPTAQLPDWPQTENTWLLVVSTGQKNTGGYSLALDDFEWPEQTLRLNVTQKKPKAGTVTTQALTTPCLVLAIPADGWNSLTVAGESPFPIIRTHP